ncbi:hypothetical protein BAR24_07530 [Gluconobacter oxydans]|nr:hypothetical protein BAR24_07530 [Gluconobacter oxydans]KXV51948.1 hypothetical protein AD946_15745 [Gluconobacter thailandicus]
MTGRFANHGGMRWIRSIETVVESVFGSYPQLPDRPALTGEDPVSTSPGLIHRAFRAPDRRGCPEGRLHGF